jgi:hypothetical protein
MRILQELPDGWRLFSTPYESGESAALSEHVASILAARQFAPDEIALLERQRSNQARRSLSKFIIVKSSAVRGTLNTFHERVKSIRRDKARVRAAARHLDSVFAAAV